MTWKRKIIEDSNVITLESQSTDKYKLLKNLAFGLYYIRRQKDLKTVLIGDRDETEPFILYGLGDEDLKQDVEQLFK